MTKTTVLFLTLLPGLALAAPPMKTVYSSTQSASFSSSNFGINRTVNGGSPDNSYSYQRTINFDNVPPSRHEKLTYSTSHAYGTAYRHYRVRRWDDRKVPFEFQNDKYIKESLALGYFFKPGERAYLYPVYAR